MKEQKKKQEEHSEKKRRMGEETKEGERAAVVVELQAERGPSFGPAPLASLVEDRGHGWVFGCSSFFDGGSSPSLDGISENKTADRIPERGFIGVPAVRIVLLLLRPSSLSHRPSLWNSRGTVSLRLRSPPLPLRLACSTGSFHAEDEETPKKEAEDEAGGGGGGE